MRSIKFISDYIVDQHILNQAERDIGYARQLSTYLFVGRRVVLFLALIGGTMLLLRFFGVFERVSISLLASAGLFTVILGVAAQHVLGDIIAGLQIALTQPIRVGDTIEFEEAWGTVERITYTYLTIYTWDERRVVVPLQYFMSRPSQNLTKTNANLIKPIYLYVDYHTNIDHIREAFTQLLEHDEDWDRNIPPTVNVTNITHEAIEVRLLCSASDPDTAWYLRFRISERIMAYLRDMKSGPYLPKQRMVIEHTDHFNGQPQHNDWHRQREHTAENAWKMPDVILRETSDSHRQPDQDHSADHH
jgi:small-conductance mechanosensitive channel